MAESNINITKKSIIDNFKSKVLDEYVKNIDITSKTIPDGILKTIPWIFTYLNTDTINIDEDELPSSKINVYEINELISKYLKQYNIGCVINLYEQYGEKNPLGGRSMVYKTVKHSQYKALISDSTTVLPYEEPYYLPDYSINNASALKWLGSDQPPFFFEPITQPVFSSNKQYGYTMTDTGNRSDVYVLFNGAYSGYRDWFAFHCPPEGYCIEMEYPQEVYLNSYQFTGDNYGASESPGTWYIEGLPLNSDTWITLQYISNYNDIYRRNLVTIPIDGEVRKQKFKKLRIRIIRRAVSDSSVSIYYVEMNSFRFNVGLYPRLENQPTIDISQLSEDNKIIPNVTIDSNNLNNYYDDLLSTLLNEVNTNNNINLYYRSCHSNCYNNCHNTRSRR